MSKYDKETGSYDDEDFDDEERTYKEKIYQERVKSLTYFQEKGLKYSQAFAHLYVTLALLERTDCSHLETYLLDARDFCEFIKSFSERCVIILPNFALQDIDMIILKLNKLLNELIFFSILTENALGSLDDVVDMEYVTGRYNILLSIHNDFITTWERIFSFHTFPPSSNSIH